MRPYGGPVDRRPRRAAPGLVRTGGYYNYSPHTGRSTQALAINTLHGVPIWFARPVTVSKLACESTAGGTAGSVVRLGLYAPLRSDDIPGALLYESSTIASTGTGTLEVGSLALHLRPGLYFLAYVAQVAAPTVRTINTGTATLGTIPTSTFGGTGIQVAYTVGSVTAALPATFSPSGDASQTALLGAYCA